jgi:hypothetical protein
VTFDLNINRGHLLIMNNPHTNFEVPRPTGKCSLVIDRNRFYQQGEYDLDLKQKNQYTSSTCQEQSPYQVGLSGFFYLLIGNRFYLQGQCDLDL